MKLGIDSRFGPHRLLTGKAFLNKTMNIMPPGRASREIRVVTRPKALVLTGVAVGLVLICLTAWSFDCSQAIRILALAVQVVLLGVCQRSVPRVVSCLCPYANDSGSNMLFRISNAMTLQTMKPGGVMRLAFGCVIVSTLTAVCFQLGGYLSVIRGPSGGVGIMAALIGSSVSFWFSARGRDYRLFLLALSRSSPSRSGVGLSIGWCMGDKPIRLSPAPGVRPPYGCILRWVGGVMGTCCQAGEREEKLKPEKQKAEMGRQEAGQKRPRAACRGQRSEVRGRRGFTWIVCPKGGFLPFSLRR